MNKCEISQELIAQAKKVEATPVQIDIAKLDGKAGSISKLFHATVSTLESKALPATHAIGSNTKAASKSRLIDRIVLAKLFPMALPSYHAARSKRGRF